MRRAGAPHLPGPDAGLTIRAGRIFPEAAMIDIKPDALCHVAGRGGHVTLYYQPLRGC